MKIILLLYTIVLSCILAIGASQSLRIGVSISGTESKELVVRDDGTRYIEHWFNPVTHHICDIEDVTQ